MKMGTPVGDGESARTFRLMGVEFAVQPTVVLLAASVIPVVWYYYGSRAFFDAHLARHVAGAGPATLHRTAYMFGAACVLMLLVPVLLARFVLRLRLRDLGLGIGDWQAGLRIVLFLFPLILVLMLFPTSRQPNFRAEYPLWPGAGRSLGIFLAYAALYAVYYLPWEFLFRGFMLFGLKDSVGVANAILIQTVPSVLVHIGKPDGEIFAAIAAGIVFGLIAWRTRSVLYVFLLHWLIGVGLDAFIVLGAN
jgi:membrane protease YdiL (CAAX protease family)